jgi:uncharacterized membrane protein YphA (DoxX/SURF4 family)
MKIIMAIPRFLLGLVFGVLPLLTILHMSPKQTLPADAMAFIGALVKSGYMMPLVWATEIVAGVLLLVGLFVPFALVVLAPVVVNIFLFHYFLAPEGLPIAIGVCVLEVIVAVQFRHAFGPLFASAYTTDASSSAAQQAAAASR